MPAIRSKRTHSPDVFGHIPDVPVGTCWASRQECSDSAVHPGIMAGIYGSKEHGAFSIVLSGGYEDDLDEGSRFLYTGSGGRDRGSGGNLRMGPQAYDQSFTDNFRNAALKRSCETGKPVRVVRGYKLNSDFAPPGGDKNYRYDGLYKVIKAWREQGKAGHLVCRFKLQRLPGQPPLIRREGTYKFRPLKSGTKRRREYSPIPEPKFEGVPIHTAASAQPSSATQQDVERVGVIQRPIHRPMPDMHPVPRRLEGPSRVPPHHTDAGPLMQMAKQQPAGRPVDGLSGAANTAVKSGGTAVGTQPGVQSVGAEPATRLVDRQLGLSNTEEKSGGATATSLMPTPAAVKLPFAAEPDWKSMKFEKC